MEFVIGLCIGIIVSPILTTLLNKVIKITWGKEQTDNVKIKKC